MAPWQRRGFVRPQTAGCRPRALSARGPFRPAPRPEQHGRLRRGSPASRRGGTKQAPHRVGRGAPRHERARWEAMSNMTPTRPPADAAFSGGFMKVQASRGIFQYVQRHLSVSFSISPMLTWSPVRRSS
jgi:hypothetical protein